MGKHWIGFDLDGTLSEYHGWVAPGHIGKPIPGMVALLKDYLSQNQEVRIVTARANPDLYPDQVPIFKNALYDWCIEHIGENLIVTCSKDQHMLMLYDDRAVQVIPNSGKSLAKFIHDYVLDLRSKNSNVDPHDVAIDLLSILQKL